MELAQYILFAFILPSFLVFAYFLKIWWKSRTRKNFIYATLALIVFMLFLIFPLLNIYESADSSTVAISTTSFFISFNASYDIYIPLQQNAFDAAIFITLTTLGLDKLTYPPYIYSRGSIIVDLVIDVNAKIILADLVATKMFNITVANETYTASLYNATKSMTSNTTFSPSISPTGAENITAQPLFYRHANGVTVLCPFADVGDHGQIDNITYYKRRIIDIRNLINNSQIFNPEDQKNRRESFNLNVIHINSTITLLLENTCTSGIFEMNNLFSNTDFNGNIASWDVSTVYSMQYMFYNTTDFNQPLNNWNVSRVTTMNYMFGSATDFNQPLNNWNVSRVTNMNYMFASATDFNQLLNNWNVGQVTTMDYMFYYATNFNQSLNNWNVSQVTNMNNMFYNATSFNQPLNNWNVAQVTKMESMFVSAIHFNQTLNNWTVSRVTTMSYMFYNALNFNQPLNNWNVTNVMYMDQMFQGAAAFYNNNVGLKNTTCAWIINALCANCLSVAHDDCPVIYFYRHENGVTVLCPLAEVNATGVINGQTYTKRNRQGLLALIVNQTYWPNLTTSCTSDVSDMTNLFYNSNFNGDIASWDVSYVVNMNGMFSYAINFNKPLNNWNVSQVTNMRYMFYNATKYNQSLNNWNVKQVTIMESMFDSAINFNQPLNTWNVGQVTSMDYMFFLATVFNQPLNNWNVSKVKTMESMFDNAINFNQPLNTWNVGQVTNMGYMFNNATSFNQPLNNWNVEQVITMEGMFSYAINFNQPLNTWNVSRVTNMNYMFYAATNFNQPLNNWNVTNVMYMDQMFQGAAAFYNNTVGFKNTTCGWISNTLCAYCLSVAHDNCPVIIYFYHHENNVTVLCPLAEINATGVINGQTYTKRDRQGLLTLIANQTYWPNLTTSCTSDVSDMTNLFYNKNFNGDIASWDVSYVVNMDLMFASAINFNQPLNTWNVGKVINMQYMFHNARNFNQPLNNWNVGRVTIMESMFANAQNFNQSLNNWNLAQVTTIEGMFYGATNFSYSLNDWNVTNVIKMRGAFFSAVNFNQPLNKWDVSKVNDMGQMFYGATNFNQPLNNWNVSKVSLMTNMFTGAVSFLANNTGMKNTTCGWTFLSSCFTCLSQNATLCL